MKKDDRFVASERIVNIIDPKARGNGIDERNLKKDYKYEVTFEYTVDGMTYSETRLEKKPFTTTDHYFYHDESGNAVEASFLDKSGVILFCCLGACCAGICVLDIVQCKKRRKRAEATI